jgi:hypothetical protein
MGMLFVCPKHKGYKAVVDEESRRVDEDGTEKKMRWWLRRK